MIDSRRRHRTDNGFTLIELLVVIIILGILSAVVVFAVRGVGDKGRGAAFATDAKTIRTAQEAYCAKAGHYATMDQLTGAAKANDGVNTYKFLSEASEYHKLLDPPPPGACNGTGFKILCLDGSDPPCALPGATPPPPAAKWVRTATDPNYPLGIDGRAVLMPNGKVLVLFNSVQTVLAEIYDPAEDTWTPTAPVPVGASSITNSATVITGTLDQCGANCGKVLVQMFSHQNLPWQLYDPLTGTWSPTTVTNKQRSVGPKATLLTGPRCDQDCSKVLVVGGATSGGDQNSIEAGRSAELYDPKLNLWTDLGTIPTLQSGSSAVVLTGDKCFNKCGKVLVTGSNGYPGRPDVATGDLLYDPRDRSWEVLPNGCATCIRDSARLLNDGRVFAGFGTTRIYDPSTNLWTPPVPTPGCDPTTSCNGFTMTLLSDGKVLKAGGRAADGASLTTAFLYDPDADSEPWTQTASMNLPRFNEFPIVARLGASNCGTNCNKVLVVGGPGAATGTAELYG